MLGYQNQKKTRWFESKVIGYKVRLSRRDLKKKTTKQIRRITYLV